MLPPLPPVIPVRELRVVVGVGVRRERFRKGRVGKAVTEGEFVEDKVEVGVWESVTPNAVVKVPRKDGAEEKVRSLDGNVEEVMEALGVPVTLRVTLCVQVRLQRGLDRLLETNEFLRTKKNELDRSGL